MRNFLSLILIIGVVLPSCLKKVESTDELNYNIYDRDYVGDVWFEVEDVYSFTTDLGELKVRFEVVIPKENLPDLQPSAIELQVDGNGIERTIEKFPKSGNGDFKGVIDFPYAGSGSTYCIELGIYDDIEESAINIFEECRTF